MVTERDLNAERNQLEAWARSSKTPARLQRRSRVVLAILRGTPLKRIAREQRVPFAMVKRWRKRYVERGLPALEKDAPRRVPPRLPKEKVAAILEATLHSKPPGATHWSTRTMAAAQAVSQSTVIRIWHAHGLKPHLMRTFKLSKDKRFVEKVEDVVGLYMNPPAARKPARRTAEARSADSRSPRSSRARSNVARSGHVLSDRQPTLLTVR